MDDGRFSRRALFSVSWIRVVLALAIVLPPLVAVWFFLMSGLPKYDAESALQIVVGLAIAVISLTFVAGMRLLSNERVIRILVSLVFLLILFFGVMSLNEPDLAFVIVPLAAALLLVFWIVNQLPAIMLGLLIVTICIEVISQIILPSVFPHSPIADLFAGSTLYGSLGLICFGCLVFACVYFPRRVEWKRYLLWYRTRPRPASYVTKEQDNNAFTLIELLIVVAIISILSSGLLSVWTYCIRAPKNLEHRAQITEILNSEMNALMTSSQVLAPSPDLRTLPIPFSSFDSRLKLTGGYTVAETEQPGVVCITVTLTHDLDEPASRHFRMVSYRRTNGKDQL